MIQVDEILNDPDLCSQFQIVRTTGANGIGGWIKNEPTTITTIGAVRNSSGGEIEMIPEADQVHEPLTFRTVEPMFTTSVQNSATSDVLVFRGDRYRVLSVKNYVEQGYWQAVATRMIGD